jgi:hypothetical protein
MATPKLHNGIVNAIAQWTVSGTFFARTGYPYTAIDTSFNSILGSENFAPVGPGLLYSSYVWGNQTTPNPVSCGGSAAITSCAGMVNGFTSVGTTTNAAGVTTTTPGPTWGNQRRNQLYGPGYWDWDLTVMKNFNFPHWESGKIGVGAQVFNILNHPNFDQPFNDLNNANGPFGTIGRTVGTPTSVYGSFLGADSSPRQIQLRATLTF